VNHVNREIGRMWFDNTNPEFNYIEQIVGGECTECADVISDPDQDDPIKFHEDYNVVAQACGRFVKKEQHVDGEPSSWSCDAWQITLLERKNVRGRDGDEKDKGLKSTKAPKGDKGEDNHRKLKMNKRFNKRNLREKRERDDSYLVVLTIAYSDLFDTRIEAEEKCPERAVYREKDIMESEYGIGAIQLVLQAGLDGNDLTDPCEWGDCYDGNCRN